MCYVSRFMSGRTSPGSLALPASTLFRVALLALVSAQARAHEPVRFGSNDVKIVFAIGKSDDHNQVQYALRLTPDCLPATKAPVFGYWRLYDDHERLLPMSWLDSIAYGIGSQAVKSSEVTMTIKTAPDRVISIEVGRDADGRCSARPYVSILGHRARLSLIFLKLSGPLSVSWVEIRGTSVDTGEPVVERVLP